MEKTVLNFCDCTLIKLDELFHLEVIDDDPILKSWLDQEMPISDFEMQALNLYQKILKRHVHDWNEAELLQHFIGPMFTLVEFSNKQFSIFSERPLQGLVDEITLKGNPDGMIASGFREPKQPYFCFQEYKKHRDPNGDPAGQCLAAMLVAQELNEHTQPVYGCYVIGYSWHFMTLHDREYCISKPYTATDDDIFFIFRVLRALRQIIIGMLHPYPSFPR